MTGNDVLGAIIALPSKKPWSSRRSDVVAGGDETPAGCDISEAILAALSLLPDY
jgi:hypothetical protein